MATLSMPSSFTLVIHSLILLEPSRRLYSVWTWRCTKLIFPARFLYFAYSSFTISKKRSPEKKNFLLSGRSFIAVIYSFCVQALAVHHIFYQFINILRLISYNLQLRDLSAGEDIRHRYILGQLGLQVQSVSFACY